MRRNGSVHRVNNACLRVREPRPSEHKLDACPLQQRRDAQVQAIDDSIFQRTVSARSIVGEAESKMPKWRPEARSGACEMFSRVDQRF
jgi:hypothetical protein